MKKLEISYNPIAQDILESRISVTLKNEEDSMNTGAGRDETDVSVIPHVSNYFIELAHIVTDTKFIDDSKPNFNELIVFDEAYVWHHPDLYQHQKWCDAICKEYGHTDKMSIWK